MKTDDVFVMTDEQAEAYQKAKDAARTVLEGFDKGIFQRNIDADHLDGWSMKLLPYVVALSELQKWTER
jgi:hypothetical protein